MRVPYHTADQRSVVEKGDDVTSGRSLGRPFAWLWGAYAVSAFGTSLAFDAFPMIAILVLHTGPTGVSMLKAAGLAVGAVLGIPLGPWVESRRKRRVMIAMDLMRFAVLMSVPAAFALGCITFTQLLIVSTLVGAAEIAFRAASGAYLKELVSPKDLLVANGRFEATTWTTIALGPPLGGLMIGLFGAVTTVVADAVSYLFSAWSISAIAAREAPVARAGILRTKDLFEGWRYILSHPTLRPLFFNSILVNGLIMATAPLMAVLMLGPLEFKPWQYGFAFGVPCIGGLIGSRLVGPLAARFGQQRVMLVAGCLRACWSIGLAFVGPGYAGIGLVVAIQWGLVTCIGVFSPLLATYRLAQTPSDRVARTLAAWSVTSSATIAGLTASWGALASVVTPRAAIAIAGVLQLATPLLLIRMGLRDSERGVLRSEGVSQP